MLFEKGRFNKYNFGYRPIIFSIIKDFVWLGIYQRDYQGFYSLKLEIDIKLSL